MVLHRTRSAVTSRPEASSRKNALNITYKGSQARQVEHTTGGPSAPKNTSNSSTVGTNRKIPTRFFMSGFRPERVASKTPTEHSRAHVMQPTVVPRPMSTSDPGTHIGAASRSTSSGNPTTLATKKCSKSLAPWAAQTTPSPRTARPQYVPTRRRPAFDSVRDTCRHQPLPSR